MSSDPRRDALSAAIESAVGSKVDAGNGQKGSGEAIWRKVEPGFVDEPYAGPLPPYLFRFRSLSAKNWKERLVQEIEQNEVYLSAFEDLNDPEERAFDPRFFGDKNAIQKFWEAKKLDDGGESAEEIASAILENAGFVPDSVLTRFLHVFGQVCRTACFTTNPYNPLMWAHYGTFANLDKVIPHGGICLQYRIDEDDRDIGLGPVLYQEQRPVIDILELTNSNGRGFRDAFFCKGTEWQYEHEWRIFLHMGSNAIDNPIRNKNSKIQFSEEKLVGIIFGLNTSPEVREEISRLIQLRSFKPALYQMVRDRLTFRLHFGDL